MSAKEMLKQKLEQMVTLNFQVKVMIHENEKLLREKDIEELLGQFYEVKFDTDVIIKKHKKNVNRYPQCQECVKNFELMIRTCEKCDGANRFLKKVER